MNVNTIRKNARALVRAAMKDPEWFTGEEERTYYLGSVLHLTPSGKLYTPWANSNVAMCKRCDGVGCEYCGYIGSREAYEDQVWWETLEIAAGRHGCWVGSGEGSMDDVFIFGEIQ